MSKVQRAKSKVLKSNERGITRHPVPKKQKSSISYFFEPARTERPPDRTGRVRSGGDPRISNQIKDLEKFGITSNQFQILLVINQIIAILQGIKREIKLSNQ